MKTRLNLLRIWFFHFKPLSFFAQLVCTHAWYNNRFLKAKYMRGHGYVRGYSFCARCGKRRNFIQDTTND